jgi:rhodanese-related sulfurtransferase
LIGGIKPGSERLLLLPATPGAPIFNVIVEALEAGVHSKGISRQDREVGAVKTRVPHQHRDAAGQGTAGSVDPPEAWRRLQSGDARLLDLRTELERRRYGVPPGAIPVSLARHLLQPEGEGAIYLCQHAVRSKATLRNGAAEVAGGFVAWRRAGLPIEKID